MAPVTPPRPAEWLRARTDRAYPGRPWVWEYRSEPQGYFPQVDLKTLLIGDIHLSDTPPGYRTDSYRHDVLQKLEWIFNEADAKEVDLILLSGDIFHHRRRVPHSLLADFADVMALADCRKLILPGNHDLVDNDLSSVESQPIGILARMPGVDLCRHPMTFGPLRIVPIPYLHNLTYEQCRASAHPNKLLWNLLWVHGGVTPHAMPFPTLVTSDPAWDPGAADVVFCGHIHDDLGVWKDPYGRLIFNLGSVSRGSLTEDNLSRIPRVLYTYWRAKPVAAEFKTWRIPCVRPSDQVFRLEDKQAELEDERISEEFLRMLGEVRLKAMSPEDLKLQISQLVDLSDAVRDNAIAAIEEVS